MTVASPFALDGAGAADTACAHCGLPVPATLRDGAGPQFCCDGCRTVYDVIHGAGLASYYRQRQRFDASPVPAAAPHDEYTELDDDAFLASHTRAHGGSLRSVELNLRNLHCPACLWLVERLPRVVPAARECQVNLQDGSARVVWDASVGPLSSVARGLASLGYPPHAKERSAVADLRRVEDRELLARIGVAGALAGNLMLIAFALYSGEVATMEAEWLTLFRWSSMLLALPAVFWCGSPLLRGAWAALRTRTPHMDLPVSVGIVTGFTCGAVNTVRGAGDVYFDSIAAIVFLLLVGRWLQRRQQHRARKATELLSALTPRRARRVEDGTIKIVPLEALRAGERIELRAGDRMPADGIVTEGHSSVDVSLLTGESVPEDVGPGARVHAGSVNLSGRLLVQVTETGQASRLGQIVASMEQAARRRAPIQLLADRVAGRFVLAVMVVALLTALGWWTVDPRRAVEHAIALLIVTCPCALGLATPLAVAAALGRAARAGFLIQGGAALERLARPSLIVFDKTGTLTEGRLRVVSYYGPEELRASIAALEATSAHPVAVALVDAFSGDRAAAPAVESARHTLGGGVEGVVAGRHLLVGTLALALDRGVTVPAALQARAEDEARRGRSPVLVACDGVAVAVAALADPLRADARATLLDLIAHGHRLALASGDHDEVVRAVVTELDVPFVSARGGVTPEGKLASVQAWRREGAVVMVGDGVNDAAALAAADVGIAVHGSAEASLAAADVYVSRAGVAPLAELAAGARRALGVIRRNMALSLVYNLVCATLAIAGIVTPLLAAILMPLSSLTVVASSFRARTFEVKP